jgi:hypothetical protein
MPAFIQIANPPYYLMPTPPLMAPGMTCYMLGIYDDYNQAVTSASPQEWSALTPETLAVGPSLEFCLPTYAGSNSNAPAIQWNITYPTAPSAVSIHLEGCVDLINGPWFQIASSTNANGDSITIPLGSTKVLAIRTHVESFTGASTVVSTALI